MTEIEIAKRLLLSETICQYCESLNIIDTELNHYFTGEIYHLYICLSCNKQWRSDEEELSVAVTELKKAYIEALNPFTERLIKFIKWFIRKKK